MCYRFRRSYFHDNCDNLLAVSKCCVVLLACLTLCGHVGGQQSSPGASANQHHDLDVNFQDHCVQGCPFQNRTDGGHFDVGCGIDCNIEQCAQGCALWRQALETSCRTVCNGTQELLPPKQLYCVIGCNDALNRYFQQLKTDLGTLPAPALVPDSLTATSLRLAWSWNKSRRKEGINNISGTVLHTQKGDGKHILGIGVSGIPHVKYLVQWRYEELAEEWQYCRNQTFGSQEDTVYVDNLQPYTKYRFRVAVLLSPHYHGPLVVSEPSVVISTLAKGVPSSAPKITRSAAVDASRISVSWEPGPFPNGPILSYVLQITLLDPNSDNDDDNNTTTENKNQEEQKKIPATTYPVLKDIPASGNTDFYMFNNLAPSSKYQMSVSMRNSVGQGPAATVTVTTPSEATVKDTQQPILILGTHHSVIQQSADMLEEPVVIYNTSKIIKGVAIHVNRKLLFVSVSAGFVYRTSLVKFTTPTVILAPGSVNFRPLDLTVDWLNEQLYILGEVTETVDSRKWRIERCTFDGHALGVAMAGLPTKPHHIEIDPYNGYLFWVSSTGLWRLDLADISNGVRREVRPTQLLNSNCLGAFTVDHTNFRLLVPHHDDNTIVSVNLDGREVLDLRNNTQKPMFRNVTSLAMAKGLFYWISGGELIAEEYHGGQDSYFHNAYPKISDKQLFTLSVNLHSCQPVPLPVNPPTDVQAILGSKKAKIAWKSPHLVGGQSKGAWQNWLYELIIHDKTHNITIVYREINTTSYTAYNLQENTEYVFKTTAYTTSGFGPFSSEFHGKTLKTPKDGKYAMIIWSAAQGLLSSDVTGDNVKTLISKSSLKDFYIRDIAWYKETLFLVTNTTHVYWYDLTRNDKGKINEIDSVESIAVDWIGKKLYWSNPKQHLITRSNLNGSQHEPLPILTLAHELNIDSINAYIYWSTGHAVESARLNGAEKKTYYTAQLFSGKQVMGLTFDIEQHSLYWIVRSFQDSVLFRAPTSDQLPPNFGPGSKVPDNLFHKTILQHNTMQGPLCFFSQKLLWLQDPRNALIGDLEGQNAGVLSGIGLSGLNMVAVVDNALHVLPDITKEDINVIPDPVSLSSIDVFGPSDAFNISWQSVNNVNYGQVFYEVKINDYFQNDAIQTTTLTSIRYPRKIKPYSEIEIIIRAFTYWGSALQSRVVLNSPPSTPSRPENLRAFITYQRRPLDDDNIVGILRWNKPIQTNGLIKGYILNSWYLDENNSEIIVYKDLTLREDQYEFEMPGMLIKTTYYFEIQAYTEVGRGDISETITISTEKELPIPKLLIASEDTISLRDFDNNENKILARSNGKIIDIAYLYNETKIIWLNDLQEVFYMDITKNDKTKILTLNSTGVSLAVDWVKRCLYWAENDKLSRNSTINSYDFNSFEMKGIIKINKILEIPAEIYHIEISPFTNSLYWTETSHTQPSIRSLMVKRFSDKYIHPFLSETNSYLNQNFCNCTMKFSVEKIFRLDHSNKFKPKLIYIESVTKRVISADMEGCICQIINMNLPLHTIVKSLSSEYDTVYVLDNANIYKNDQELFDGNSFEIISSLGFHCQPYPWRNCLRPQSSSLIVDIYNASSNSLTFKMPEPYRDYQCYNFSIPTIQYNIYYMPYNDGDVLHCNISCSHLFTFEKKLTVNGLRPFSKYLFSVSLSNYYSEILHEIPNIGLAIVAQTAAGAPSKPRNVTAVVLNPTTVKVSWLPPCEFNDEAIFYETHTEGTLTSGKHRFKQKLEEPNQSSLNIHRNHYKYETTELEKLLPNQTYTISIRAYSKNSGLYTESDVVQIETYREPNEIQLVSASPYSLNISWTISPEIIIYKIQYMSLSDIVFWKYLNESDTIKVDGNQVMYQVRNLEPKSKYIFRLALTYPNMKIPYIWPVDTKFEFETLGDKPSPPGVPTVQRLRQDVYQITWKPSRENGSPIQMYKLEGKSDGTKRSEILARAAFRDKEKQFIEELYGERKRRSVIGAENDDSVDSITILTNENIKEINDSNNNEANQILTANHSRFYSEGLFVHEDEAEWEIYYNGTENYWIISDLASGQRYWFRASALNQYGWSDPSDMSTSFEPGAGASEARLAHKPQQWTIILAIIVPILFTVFIILLICFVCVFKQRNKENKHPQTISPIRTLGPDVELATLRDMPRGRPGSTFVHSTNALYTSSDGVPIMGVTDSLPHIRRDQITLTKFLGSGAFGEVFEGKAKCLDGISGETRVAVKTLRKGASTQERAEFLREAQLMAHFRHPHILRLLGVCRDNDPHFIIMELMLAGDLLSYLRTSRPLLQTPQALTLLDLFSMCVDVARGCRYLEEQHFVHRDLACRNCLVSSPDPANRVVKIGDFGLARDVYKNDYYRKEGEGLLPVRWMAPESLVDGVFTSQSDVWAFGVLIWEIMTLGQQPYPARTNLEVLHYVRNGGRLHRPNNCKEELHNLMLKCWSYNPEVRPTFKHCLEVLERLKSQCVASPLAVISASENATECYITPVRNNAIDYAINHAYFLDANSYCSSSADNNISYSNEPCPDVVQTPSHQSQQSTNQTSSESQPMETPKYLEIIYDLEDALPTSLTSTDGYEIPRSSIRSNKCTIENNVNTTNFERPRALSSSSTKSGSSATQTTELYRNGSIRSENSNKQFMTRIEKYLPKNGFKQINDQCQPIEKVKCAYSNIKQSKLVLERDCALNSDNDETRQENRLSFNSHSMC